MKKTLSILSAAGVVLSALTPVLAQEGPITVISREDGSGTRGAFVEIVGVVDENDDDMTTLDASIQNQTSGVMQAVANDPSAIGYISLGSLDDSVKAVKIDGAEATPEAIIAEEYPIARPFYVAWGDDLSAETEDFLTFIHSKQGQTIVEEEGYIAVAPSEAEGEEEVVEEEAAEGEEEAAEGEEEVVEEEAAEGEEEAAEGEEEVSEGEEVVEEAAEEGANIIDSLPDYVVNEELEGGTIEIVGSTSVTPVMERLAEEYSALTGVTINVQSVGSSAGIQAAIDGTADLGMSSRSLTDEENAALNSDRIAMDGIAVIVNNENPLEELSLEVVRQIFLGEIVDWAEAQ